MSRIAATLGLLPMLGGLMLLGGCTTLVHDGYPTYPVYSSHVDVVEYRYRNPHGLVVVYDSGPGLYAVVSRPGLYWHDGHYYRKHQDRWEHSRHYQGPWVIHRHEPPRAKVRQEHPSARRWAAPIAAPDPRHERGPAHRPPRGEEPRRGAPRDHRGGRVVDRPPEQTREPERTFDRSHWRSERFTVPEQERRDWGANRSGSQPRRFGPAALQQMIDGGEGPRPEARGRPRPGVDQAADRPRSGPASRQRERVEQANNRPPVRGDPRSWRGTGNDTTWEVGTRNGARFP